MTSTDQDNLRKSLSGRIPRRAGTSGQKRGRDAALYGTFRECLKPCTKANAWHKRQERLGHVGNHLFELFSQDVSRHPAEWKTIGKQWEQSDLLRAFVQTLSVVTGHTGKAWEPGPPKATSAWQMRKNEFLKICDTIATLRQDQTDDPTRSTKDDPIGESRVQRETTQQNP